MYQLTYTMIFRLRRQRVCRYARWFLLLFVLSCSREEARLGFPADKTLPPELVSADRGGESPESPFDHSDRVLTPGFPDSGEGGRSLGSLLNRVLNAAEIPSSLSRRIEVTVAEDPTFLLDLLSCLQGDVYLRVLVDKTHALPSDYAPVDLVELEDHAYQVNRAGLLLRRAAAEALEEMALAAKAQGVTLTASSAYRSYRYQQEVYSRIVRELGQDEADRESARPGHSQHQLGLVVDFGSIDDAFADTRAGRWMAANGSRFGWSLSFPQGYEGVTGYRWESWHYRYVGRDLCLFIDTYFDGIQQYALRFIHEWEKAGGI